MLLRHFVQIFKESFLLAVFPKDGASIYFFFGLFASLNLKGMNGRLHRCMHKDIFCRRRLPTL